MPAADTTPAADPLVWQSFLWGLLSASSLNIGSVIGVTYLPKKKVRAVLMSFGGGALLFALSVELFGHTLSMSEVSGHGNEAVWIMEGSAVLGGLLFASLNRFLNEQGADVRKHSTSKGRFARLHALFLRRLAVRLWKVPFFSTLSIQEVRDLVQFAMYKERFNAGDVIMNQANDSGIYFIISGMVRLQIFDDELQSSTLLSQELECSTPLSVDWDCEVSASGTPMPNTWNLGPNQIFGDMAVLTGSHTDVVVKAIRNTKVLVLPGHEVTRLLKLNDSVREQVSLCAVQSLQKVPELSIMPRHALASLSARCTLKTYQPGEMVFHGTVDCTSPLLCVILGSVEVTFEETGARKVRHASCLLCAENLKGKETKAYTVVTLEHTSVLTFERSDIDDAICHSPRLKSLRRMNKCWDLTVPMQYGSTVVPDSHHGVIAVAAAAAASPSISQSPAPCVRIAQMPSKKANHLEVVTHNLDAWLPPTPVDAGDSALPGEVNQSPRGTLRDPACGATPIQSVLPQEASRGGAATMTAVRTRLQSQEIDIGASRLPSKLSGSGVAGASSERFRTINGTLGWGGSKEGQGEDDRDLEAEAQACLRKGLTVTRLHDHISEADLIEQQRCHTPASHFSTGSKQKSNRVNPEEPVPPKESPKAQMHIEEPDAEPAASVPSDAADKASKDNNSHAAIMVWLGILIDAVPESMVIGILVNRSVGDNKSQAAAALPFVISVFLSNLPEAMSSAGSMKAHGMRMPTILVMWMMITGVTACGAAIGAAVFPPSTIKQHSTELVVSGVEGLAAGAMLTMIAQTMMPEAFEQGGDVVGVSCLVGFLTAMTVKLMPVG